MIYYQSNYLASRLDINIAKWKRWVREFLPPDALGGFQSGYARQFSLKEAFRVFLGGVLVGSLKYSIPESKLILNDLHSWMKDQGFYSLRVFDSDDSPSGEHYFRIYIYPLASAKFGYTIRSIQSIASNEDGMQYERFAVSSLATSSDLMGRNEIETARVLCISKLYANFLSRIKP
jgi:hypothetical protein